MTLETVTSCPACRGTSFRDWLQCRDYLVSGETYTIQECDSCGFKLTNPRPGPEDIGRYYQSDQYISHSDTRQGLVSQLYHSVRSITLKQKVNLLNQLKPAKGAMLDMGCGSGYFLEACQQAGWQVNGMEPDPSAREQATKRVGKSIAPAKESLPAAARYDVITLWHVLEHIHALEETMTWMRDHTQPDGHLIIAVPNHKSWDAQHYQNQWAAFDVPRHLYHFSPDRLKALLEKHRFQLLSQRPMLFDAFYVNLLSTKYRDGKPAYVESFVNGLRSNLAAARNGGNYSSVIYIARAH